MENYEETKQTILEDKYRFVMWHTGGRMTRINEDGTETPMNVPQTTYVIYGKWNINDSTVSAGNLIRFAFKLDNTTISGKMTVDYMKQTVDPEMSPFVTQEIVDMINKEHLDQALEHGIDLSK